MGPHLFHQCLRQGPGAELAPVSVELHELRPTDVLSRLLRLVFVVREEGVPLIPLRGEPGEGAVADAEADASGVGHGARVEDLHGARHGEAGIVGVGAVEQVAYGRGAVEVEDGFLLFAPGLPLAGGVALQGVLHDAAVVDGVEVAPVGAGSLAGCGGVEAGLLPEAVSAPGGGGERQQEEREEEDSWGFHRAEGD